MSVKEVKKKVKSLRSYFAKEQQKVTEKNDAGVDDVYDSLWLAYKSLMSISIAGIFRVFFFFLIFFKTINAALIPANIAASDTSTEFTVYTCYKLNDY